MPNWLCPPHSWMLLPPLVPGQCTNHCLPITAAPAGGWTTSRGPCRPIPPFHYHDLLPPLLLSPLCLPTASASRPASHVHASPTALLILRGFPYGPDSQLCCPPAPPAPPQPLPSPSPALVLRRQKPRGAWVAQSVEHPTVDLGSGHDLTACGFEPHIRLCVDSMEPAWDSLLLSLPLTHSL